MPDPNLARSLAYRNRQPEDTAPRTAVLAVGFALFFFLALLPISTAQADLVELISGAKVEGRVISRDDQYVVVEVKVGGRDLSRKYPVDRVAALTIDGKREVLNEAATSKPKGATPAARVERSRAEVESLIETLGSTPPDWWDSVPLDYPKTLDLSWPMPPPDPWNARKNVGQFVWDVVNPNPSKWRLGIRLMHHLLSVHENNPPIRRRAMMDLGRMYHDLLQDYGRAAFWWRKAEVQRDGFGRSGVHLAECYWKLGNRKMALELLEKLPPHFSMIKLWAEMGEIELAIRLAQANLGGGVADIAFIYAGDAFRTTGHYDQAAVCYERLLKLPVQGRGRGRIERNQQRARANLEAIRLFELLDLKRVPDGTYRGQSPGFVGPIHVEVDVRGGRIEAVRVTKHEEKQFYSALRDTPRNIIEKQSVQGIDATSSATITSEAIINATAKALGGGMQDGASR